MQTIILVACAATATASFILLLFGILGAVPLAGVGGILGMALSVAAAYRIGLLKVPHWRSLPLAAYALGIQKVPREVIHDAERVWKRLPKAEFRVSYLAYTSDPILSVAYGGAVRNLRHWQ